VLGAAEGFLRVEPLGGLSFLSNDIRREERRDRHFVRAARFWVALTVLRGAVNLTSPTAATSMNSTTRRFFNTLRTLRHENPLVLNPLHLRTIR
jgi:hypothetical protein